MSPTSIGRGYRFDLQIFSFDPIERKLCEHISRPGCMGEQQAMLATSLVETLLICGNFPVTVKFSLGKKIFLQSGFYGANYRLTDKFSLNRSVIKK